MSEKEPKYESPAKKELRPQQHHRSREPLGSDAHDGEGALVDPDRLADQIAIESRPLPERVTDDHHGNIAARPLLVAREGAPFG